MQKQTIITLLKAHGDAAVEFYKKVGKESIVVTTEFNNAYIKRKGKRPKLDIKRVVMVWSWTDDKYIKIIPDEVKTIIPLNTILGNK